MLSGMLPLTMGIDVAVRKMTLLVGCVLCCCWLALETLSTTSHVCPRSERHGCWTYGPTASSDEGSQTIRWTWICPGCNFGFPSPETTFESNSACGRLQHDEGLNAQANACASSDYYSQGWAEDECSWTITYGYSGCIIIPSSRHADGS